MRVRGGRVRWFLERQLVDEIGPDRQRRRRNHDIDKYLGLDA
jgi:hypothetical protein